MTLMEEVWAAIRSLLGLDVNVAELQVGQMAGRAIVVYVAVLLMVRIGEKRFLGKNTAFDYQG